MDVCCVCLVGADGRVVEGRFNTLSATTARSARVRVPSGKGAHGCISVVYVCECEVEWAWVAGESAPEPRRNKKKIYIFFKKVARWPHGCRRKYSEVAVPMLVGSNPTEGGGFFQRKETPPGHGCVCMSPRG
jgi:hypothetical protein